MTTTEVYALLSPLPLVVLCAFIYVIARYDLDRSWFTKRPSRQTHPAE